MKTRFQIPFAPAHWVMIVLLLGTTVALMAASPGGHGPRAVADVENTLSTSSRARILAPSRQYRFPVQQAYFYNADWHLLSAGTAKLTMESSPDGQHALVTADTSGVFNLLFAVHDQFRTTINPHNYCSLGVSKH